MEALVWKKYALKGLFIYNTFMYCECMCYLSIFVFMLYEPEHQHENFPLSFLLACLHFPLKGTRVQTWIGLRVARVLN